MTLESRIAALEAVTPECDVCHGNGLAEILTRPSEHDPMPAAIACPGCGQHPARQHVLTGIRPADLAAMFQAKEAGV